MFETLKQQPEDGILKLMAAYRDDPRDAKIDLGVGVYKDADGNTPIMRAVKEAERRLHAQQTTKSYVGLIGDPAYNAAMRDLILADSVDADRLASAATPGGTGAVRQAFELARLASPDLTVWHSDPTWPNHLSILDHLGIARRSYRYFDSETKQPDIDGMIADLAQAKPGDLILLHGCCHNPTGANPTQDDWTQIIEAVRDSGATAMIDLAYQGFGDGLNEDARATRRLAAELPELLIAASCSKNFGIYRERTGILIAATDPARRATMQGTLAYLNRQNYSFPPDHGARLVTMVLGDADLRADWEAELEEMRTTMLSLRESLAAELRRLTNSDRFDFLARHRGMFSQLGCDSAAVERLRAEHGIYMVSDSRMNIAGLNRETVPILARAIAETL